jgi:hypothetical protein
MKCYEDPLVKSYEFMFVWWRSARLHDMKRRQDAMTTGDPDPVLAVYGSCCKILMYSISYT